MGRLGYAIVCGLLFASTSAYAQVGEVVDSSGTDITLHNAPAPTFTNLQGMGTQGTGFPSTVGGDYNSYVTVGDLITFESSNSVSGNSIRTTSYSEVAFDFNNPTGEVVTFNSTIIPAGLGFYLADTRGECLYSTCAGLGVGGEFDLQNLHRTDRDGTALLAAVGFEFDILDGERSLYSLNGSLSLFDNSDGVYIEDGLDAARAGLSGFTQATSLLDGSALGYAWDETHVSFLLDSLDDELDLEGFGHSLIYRTRVFSYTNADCVNQFTCLVAYSGFGDPIGRGGAVEALEAFSFSLASFGGLGALATDGITGVNFTPSSFGTPTFKDGVLSFVRVDSAAVPEPATWAMMILGFGGIGTVVRRRRLQGAHA